MTGGLRYVASKRAIGKVRRRVENIKCRTGDQRGAKEGRCNLWVFESVAYQMTGLYIIHSFFLSVVIVVVEVGECK